MTGTLFLYDPDNYTNVEDAEKSGALYLTQSSTDDGTTSLQDAMDAAHVAAECVGRKIACAVKFNDGWLDDKEMSGDSWYKIISCEMTITEYKAKKKNEDVEGTW